MSETNTEPQENTQSRSEFLEDWRKLEKRIKRFGGIFLFFAGALILAFDRPADQLTLLVAAGLIAGGLTLIFRSRSVQKHAYLFFLQPDKLSSRGMMTGLGTAFLFYQAFQTGRALFLIGAIIVGAISVWYNWRAYKAMQYTLQYARNDELNLDKENDTES